MPRTVIVPVPLIGCPCPRCAPLRSGWDVAWFDEFDGTALNTSRWRPVFSTDPTNNSQHAYLPSQVNVSNGNLVLTSTNQSYQGLPYRSGQVVSTQAQRLGRWEVRAKLPTSRGMWPAIWLLPDTVAHRWPSGGEIDIMENRGDQPELTSSAFHYGTNPPYQHSFVYSEQKAYQAGSAVNYHDSFHTYAVEWETDQLRFFVDDVHYYTVYDADVDGFLSNNTAPMETVINTAVGGDFLDNPDGTTVWPQQFLIDHVYVYNKSAVAEVLTFENGGFEQNGGSLANWTTFGNRLPNVRGEVEAVQTGDGSLKLFGQFNGGANYSGVSQGISVTAGEELRAVASAFTRDGDSISGTPNRVDLQIEYYRRAHGRLGTGDYIRTDVIRLADGTSPESSWLQNEIRSNVPSGAVEARVVLLFTQENNQRGAVHVDDVFFGGRGATTLSWHGEDGDWNSGAWTGGPYAQPTDFDNAFIESGRVTVTGNANAYQTLIAGGILQMNGHLISADTQIAAGASLTGVGWISGDLQLDGTLLVSQNTSLQVLGAVQLDEAAELLLGDDFSQPRGTYSDLVVLSATSVTGQFNMASGSGVDAHFGDGLFLADVLYAPDQVELSIYAAIAGDANGDGIVDTSDFNIWNTHKFQSGTDWTTGDFDGDGVTDATDFNLWNANKFTSAARPVPEPSSLLAVWLGVSPLLIRFRGRRVSPGLRA